MIFCAPKTFETSLGNGVTLRPTRAYEKATNVPGCVCVCVCVLANYLNLPKIKR